MLLIVHEMQFELFFNLIHYCLSIYNYLDGMPKILHKILISIELNLKIEQNFCLALQK